MRRGIATLTATLAGSSLLALAASAEARTFEVNKLGDPAPNGCTRNHCTLREAILRANNSSAGPDRIVLPNRRRRYELAIPNADPMVNEDGAQTGDLDVTNDPLTILHRGRGLATIDGNGLDRVLDAFTPLTLKRIKVTGGDSQPYTDGGGDSGGGVRTGARLRVVKSRVVANEGDHGGGIAGSAGSQVKIVRSTIARNEDTDGGAGLNLLSALPSSIVRSQIVRNRQVWPPGSEGGGIDVFDTRLTISRSTIAANLARREGGGIEAAEADLRIRNSTISDNRAIRVGVTDPSGGGIYAYGGDLTIVNSTVHGNSSDAEGGGIYTDQFADVTLNAVTLARNVAAASDPGAPSVLGGGFYHGSAGAFSVRNSIVALNRAGSSGVRSDCAFATTPPLSLGSNLLSSDGPAGACEGFTAPGDRFRSNPKLGKLSKNGGPTKTVALKRGSPAIGKAHRPSAPNRDQRGRKRDRKPDIGAFERGA